MFELDSNIDPNGNFHSDSVCNEHVAKKDILGLISYENLMYIQDGKRCNHVLAMDLVTNQILGTQFHGQDDKDNNFAMKGIQMSTLSEKYGISDIDISTRAMLADVFEQRAQSSWIAESMFFGTIRFTWEPIRWDVIAHDDDSQSDLELEKGKPLAIAAAAGKIAKHVYPILVIVARGNNNKLYPFGIPLGSRDDIDGCLKTTAECIPLSLESTVFKHLKKGAGFSKNPSGNANKNKWVVLEHNIYPRLAIPLPQEMIEDVYDAKWNFIHVDDDQISGQLCARRPTYPVQENERLQNRKIGGEYQVLSADAMLTYNRVEIRSELKEVLKQILIKALAFHIRVNPILIDEHLGGLRSIEDLGKSDEFVTYYQYQQSLIDMEHALYAHDD